MIRTDYSLSVMDGYHDLPEATANAGSTSDGKPAMDLNARQTASTFFSVE